GSSSSFVQAEDGIRDRNVTGVQTCALPIYRPPTIAISVLVFVPVTARFSWPDAWVCVPLSKEAGDALRDVLLETSSLTAFCMARPSLSVPPPPRSEEHTSELQSRFDLVCRLLLEKK